MSDPDIARMHQPFDTLDEAVKHAKERSSRVKATVYVCLPDDNRFRVTLVRNIIPGALNVALVYGLFVKGKRTTVVEYHV